MSKLKGRDPGGGGATRKKMPRAPGNAVRVPGGGGVDDTGGDAVARQITRLSLDERPPHSAMNPERNNEDVNVPGARREQHETGKPLRSMGMKRSKGLRGSKRSATR
jgi:hypothetical protein